MEKDVVCEDLVGRANEKIVLGHELIESLDKIAKIPGVQKVQRKIKQEIKFLEKVIESETVKLNYIQCSNLTHYEFLVKILKLQRDVVHVDCSFALQARNNPLRVDVVCEHGQKWVKAIARNSKSLTDTAKGAASYGARSILDQAQEFVDATAQHLCMFKRPKVVFFFSQSIENELLEDLQAIGVETGSVEQTLEGESDLSEEHADVSTLNLDITTLLAYVSAVCNGSCNWIFQETILAEQAERERQSPLKPTLDKLFTDKHLICCETAHRAFADIIALLGGAQERQRATALMQRIDILPDVAEIPEEFSVIRLSGKINQRSLKIFAFGMQMKALTVTSNKAFIRSAKMQGINIPVFTHQARALTEAKEETGIPLH